MAIPRKTALKRLRGLRPRVQEHLKKIHSEPGHSSQAHWRHEVRGWLREMKAMVEHVGEKTGEEWRPILEAFDEQLRAALEGQDSG